MNYFARIVSGLFLITGGIAQAQTDAGTPVSDEDIWQQLQSLSETQVEESLWEAAEAATERVFGHGLDQENGETVFQTIEAAADGDWRNAFETAGPSLLSAYLPGVSQYVEAIQTAAAQIDRSTDQWAEQLYDHESYYWVGEQVDARVAAMNGPMLDDYGDPFYGRINDDDEAFMPSYALPDGSPAKERARQFEAELFNRFTRQPFYDELIATDYTANGGGTSGLYENSYAAMIREELGYQPEPRRLFNHFYHRYTRDRLARYQEVHEYVQAELMRREARRQRTALIEAYREALEAEAPSVDQMLSALRANDVNAVRRGLAAGFDPNVWPEGANLPFMYIAGVTLAQDPSTQPAFDLLVEAGGEVRPDVPDGTPEVLPAAIRSANEAGALAVINAGFRTQVSYAEGDSMLRRAVMTEMPRVIARLTTIGHDPDIRDDEGHPLIMEAVHTGNRAVLDAVIEGGANVNARSTSNNGNAILLAGMHDHAALVPTLINAGAQIDSLLSETQPYSALMIAAMQGHFETVRALAEAGADLTIEASRGTAADYARSNGHDEVADYLDNLEDASQLDSLTPAEIAHRYGNDVAQAARDLDGDRIRQILDELGPERERMPVNYCARGEFPFCDERIGGFAAMHMAYAGDVETLARLNETGIGLEYESANGNSSTLIAAVVAGRPEAVDFLLNNAGLDPNDVTANGRSALAAAAARNDSRMVADLLAAGAIPGLGTLGGGLSALHHAAIHGNLQMINDLRNAGAQATPDSEGRMPGYYSYWLHEDENLAVNLGYAEARGYAERERRRNAPGFDWNEFAREMQPVMQATLEEIEAAHGTAYRADYSYEGRGSDTEELSDDTQAIVDEWARVGSDDESVTGSDSGSASGSCQPDGVVTRSRTGTDGIDVRLNVPCGSYTGRTNYCGMSVYVWESGGLMEAPGIPNGAGDNRLFVKTRLGEILASCE